MRINEIFALLQTGLSEPERIRAQNLVRRIILKRKEMLLCNDVSSLYCERLKVADHLGVPVGDLDVVWALQRVRDEVDEIISDDDGSDFECEDDDADIETDTDADSDTDKDTEAHTDADTDADTDAEDRQERERQSQITAHLIQDMCVVVMGLKRTIILFSLIVLIVHSTAALATIVTLTTACTPLAELKSTVWLSVSNATTLIRHHGSMLIQRFWP